MGARNLTILIGTTRWQGSPLEIRRRAVTPAGTIGLDAGYVRSRHRRRVRSFAVIARKIIDASRTRPHFVFAPQWRAGDDFARAPVRGGVAGGTPLHGDPSTDCGDPSDDGC